MLRAVGGQGGPWEPVKEMRRHQVDPAIFIQWSKEQQIDHLMFMVNEYKKLHKAKLPKEFAVSRDRQFIMRNKTRPAGKPNWKGSVKGAHTRSFRKDQSQGRGSGRGQSLGRGRGRGRGKAENQLGMIRSSSQPNVRVTEGELDSSETKSQSVEGMFCFVFCCPALINRIGKVNYVYAYRFVYKLK